MSENKPSVSDANQPDSRPGETQEEYVSRKAFEEVTRDMHKYKKEREELKAARNELEAQLKAQEEAKLHEKEQFKELFEKRNAELEQMRKEAQMERERFTKASKRAALKEELGGQIRDEYLNFANLESIAMTEEGIIDRETVRNVANMFRKEHGQLIPSKSSAEITGQAPNVDEVTQNVDLSKMNSRELLDYYAKQKLNQ